MFERIGENTVIHHTVMTYGACSVGAKSLILENVVLGYPTAKYLVDVRDHNRFIYEFDYQGTSLADNCIVRAGSTIYMNVQIGNNFRTGHNVLIREDTNIGEHVVVGTATVIDAEVSMGSFISIQSQVYISTGCIVEDNVFMGPNCVLLNDKYPIRKGGLTPARINKGASIGGNCTVLPGVTVGEGALVAAGTVVTKDVPPWHLAKGTPARFTELDDDLRKENKIN
jgi:acetyltransferase-like isoleucine patch superfamily enzyme